MVITADHGPAVSGAVNTIVTARAGKDLLSSLTAGLLTIVSAVITMQVVCVKLNIRIVWAEYLFHFAHLFLKKANTKLHLSYLQSTSRAN